MKNDLTIVIVSYKSGNILLDCLRNIKKFQRILVLDNSNDINLKKIVKIKFPNVKFFLSKKNLGYPRGNNFLLKKVKTKYVILLNPDTTIKFTSIIKLLETAKKLKDDFAIITPKKNSFPLKNYFINSLNYSQINKNKKLLEIDKVYFYAPLFNMLKFKKYKFFDENIFLYYEDNDFFYRCINLNLKMYIIKNCFHFHAIKQSSSAIMENENEKYYSYLLSGWHGQWSKFYYYKKHKNYITSFFICFPSLLKNLIQLIINITYNQQKAKFYYFKIEGLVASILGFKSYKRSIYD